MRLNVNSSLKEKNEKQIIVDEGWSAAGPLNVVLQIIKGQKSYRKCVWYRDIKI